MQSKKNFSEPEYYLNDRGVAHVIYYIRSNNKIFIILLEEVVSHF